MIRKRKKLINGALKKLVDAWSNSTHDSGQRKALSFSFSWYVRTGSSYSSIYFITSRQVVCVLIVFIERVVRAAMPLIFAKIVDILNDYASSTPQTQIPSFWPPLLFYVGLSFLSTGGGLGSLRSVSESFWELRIYLMKLQRLYGFLSVNTWREVDVLFRKQMSSISCLSSSSHDKNYIHAPSFAFFDFPHTS